jgi:hypothetical protein
MVAVARPEIVGVCGVPSGVPLGVPVGTGDDEVVGGADAAAVAVAASVNVAFGVML